jgi:hypothetical protein
MFYSSSGNLVHRLLPAGLFVTNFSPAQIELIEEVLTLSIILFQFAGGQQRFDEAFFEGSCAARFE